MNSRNNEAVKDRWIFIYIYPVFSFLVVHIGNENTFLQLLRIPSYYSDVLLALVCSAAFGFYIRRMFHKLDSLYSWQQDKKNILQRVLLKGLVLPVLLILSIEIVYLEFFLGINISESSIFILEFPVILGFCLIVNLLYLLLYLRKSIDELSGQAEVKGREYKSDFIVRRGATSSKVNIGDIAYFFVEEKVTFIVTRTGQKFLMHTPLDELERIISPSVFFRLNRQYIVNRQAVIHFEKTQTRRLKVKLEHGTSDDLFVSKARAGTFEAWLSSPVKA